MIRELTITGRKVVSLSYFFFNQTSCIVDHEKYLWAVARYIEKIRYAQGWIREPKTIPIRAPALMLTAIRMLSYEKTSLVMTDEGIIYSCCGLIYLKKNSSVCAMRQKREGLLVVRSLWSRWK
jgi:hypothetical protein